MIDLALAGWLADLIQQTVEMLDSRPGLTCEVEGDEFNWVQVIPEPGQDGKLLDSYLLNFAFRGHFGNPLEVLRHLGVSLPPGTRCLSWEDGSHATLRVRGDIPVAALALLVGSLHQKVGGAPDDLDLSVQIQHGL